MTISKPSLSGILETVLYCREETREKMLRFYDETLGLAECRISAGGYRLGPGVLLIFNADKSSNQSSPPPHGTMGRAHTCFVSQPGSYDRWKEWLRDAQVEIIEEIEWEPPFQGRSFYFHDPAGNVLEIADRDIWPRSR